MGLDPVHHAAEEAVVPPRFTRGPGGDVGKRGRREHPAVRVFVLDRPVGVEEQPFTPFQDDAGFDDEGLDADGAFAEPLAASSAGFGVRLAITAFLISAKRSGLSRQTAKR